MLHPEVGAVRVRGVGCHHRGVGPARRPLLGDGRGDRRVLGLEQVHLERPGPRGDDALVLEVVDLDHRVVPVAPDELALLAQQVERRGVLLLAELVGVRDAELGLVRHQVLGGVGDVDRPVIGLHPALVRLAVGQRLLLEHHRPGRRRLLEHLGRVHQHVRAPLVGRAVVHAVDGEPGRVLQPVVDLRPGRDEVGVDRLHPLAGHEPERGVAGGGDEVEAALVHQRHHLVGGVGGLDVDLAAGRLLELGHPVEGRVGLAALDVARPGDDVELALAGAERRHLREPRLRQRAGDKRGGCRHACQLHAMSPCERRF